MKIHRMTSKGKNLFIEHLDKLSDDPLHQFPDELLSNLTLSEVVGGNTDWLDKLDLEDCLATAKGLDEIVTNLGLSSVERDWGFWTWCSAYLFDRLCKRDSNNRYKPGELPIWIAEPHNWKRYYRHYLASIWRVYSTHRSKENELVVLLSGPVNTPGELWGQIAATQTLITNKSMIDVIHHLYWDKTNHQRKRGAGGISPRRLTRVLKQFERTYDFFSMTETQIINLLPTEFDKFKEVG